MKRILLVEDDKKLSRLVQEYLVAQGYQVMIEPRGDKAVYRILNENYFLVILDINLPQLDGLQVCKIVRKDFHGLILMLTARSANEDQITGLEYGADDYIHKPTQPDVLLARIKALSRRLMPAIQSMPTLSFGKLHLDLEKRIVKLNHKEIELKKREFDLLKMLAINAGTCLTRDNITYAIRGVEYDGVDRSIDLRISYLRHKLDDDVKKPFRIQTLRGNGYILQPDAWD
jgi:two-component system, OmpR family, response regulator